MRIALVLLAGCLFGVGLAISGMTDPAKVIGFLDVTGDWNPALAFVMAGALAVFAVGSLILRKMGRRLPEKICLPDTSADPVSRRLVVGSTIFGAGWGLSGFCPGPAIANLAWPRPEVLWIIPAMLAGMFVAQRAFRLDR